MLTIKANYQNGKITFLDAMPEKIKKARLTIVVEPEENEASHLSGQEFHNEPVNNETEFEAIGLNEFFNDENDKNIDWEDYFGLK